ncbi:MAG: REP-associated tyrosine transposase [Tepidisphaeraceae bacterium]
MPNYRRATVAGGTYFFTVVTGHRRPILTGDALRLLREAIEGVRVDHPFTLDAIVVLPDHLHAIWTMPPDDANFSTRWRLIKANFTSAYRALVGRHGPPPALESGEENGFSRAPRGERDVWQQRFMEHWIRDEQDLHRHLDYLHYNPVKHGHATCPHAWKASSFHRFVREQVYSADWCCQCVGPAAATRGDDAPPRA